MAAGNAAIIFKNGFIHVHRTNLSGPLTEELSPPLLKEDDS